MIYHIFNFELGSLITGRPKIIYKYYTHSGLLRRDLSLLKDNILNQQFLYLKIYLVFTNKKMYFASINKKMILIFKFKFQI